MRTARARRRGARVAILAIVGALAVPNLAESEPTSLPTGPARVHGGSVERGGASRPRLDVFTAASIAVEPTLGVTDDGSVYYTSMTSNTDFELVKSSDHGRTWTAVSPTLASAKAHHVTLDPYVYVDPSTSRIFNVDLTVACSYVSYSDDEGETWRTNPLACGRPVNDHQTLFAGPPAVSPAPAYPNVVYYCFNDVGTTACSKSLDGGTAFVPTGSPAFTAVDPAANGSSACSSINGHGVVDADGVVYLPKAHCAQPWLATSEDEGATWTRVQISDIGVEGAEMSLTPGFTDPSVAIDTAGNVYYAWVAGDGLPYLATSRDRGKTWSKPVTIGAPGLTKANLLTVDAGDPGKVVLAYYGSPNSGPRDGGVQRWNGYVTVTENALSGRPSFWTGSVNPPADPLVRGPCGPGRCQAVADFIDVVVAPDGTAWASFVDACPDACPEPAGGRGPGLAAHVTGIRLR